MPTFDDFWALYPNRTAKKDAIKAWTKIVQDETLAATICQAVRAQKLWRSQQAAQRKWVPEWALPGTWLRGERWHDETPGVTVTRKTVLVFEGEEIDLV